MKTQQLLAFTLAVIAMVSSHACEYYDGFRNNGDGTLTDPRDGLIWMRCLQGQEWQGTSCGKGTPKALEWSKALETAVNTRALGRSDWRLPTLQEFKEIVGTAENCKIAGRAISRYFTGIDSSAEWKTIWTATPGPGSRPFAWFIDVSNGMPAADREENSVVLVRGGNVANLTQFLEEYRIARGELTETEVSMAREKRADAERKRERMALLAAFQKTTPQNLYLQAGRLEREKATDKAREIYEYLIKQNSTTVWATKANDRLLAIQANEEAEDRSQLSNIKSEQSSSRQNSLCPEGFGVCMANCSYATPAQQGVCQVQCRLCK